MEMEHINENTVLIRIANQDLIDRGVSLTDLFTNPTQVEPFFHGLLEELNLMEQFSEAEALTFQVLPHADGIELYVTNAANMTGLSGGVADEAIINQISELIANPKIKENEQKADEVELAEKIILEETDIDKTIIFSEFEDLIELAKQLKNETIESTLFEYNGRYFLSINIDKDNQRKDEIIAIVFEYGDESLVGQPVLHEYGHVVMKDQALETIRQFFK